jgi:hypothetical protein
MTTPPALSIRAEDAQGVGAVFVAVVGVALLLLALEIAAARRRLSLKKVFK